MVCTEHTNVTWDTHAVATAACDSSPDEPGLHDTYSSPPRTGQTRIRAAPVPPRSRPSGPNSGSAEPRLVTQSTRQCGVNHSQGIGLAFW